MTIGTKNKMQSAIKKAIEGGWIPTGLVGQMTYGMEWRPYPFGGEWLWCKDDISLGYWLDETAAFLDPAFWQALGKAMKWSRTYNGRKEWVNKMWLAEWHDFIDHLAAGKSADEFFNDLLK